MNALTASRTWHDDWMVNVLLSDGRLYAFVTECWPEWAPVPAARQYTGDYTGLDWAPIIARAQRYALELATRDAEPFCAELDPALSEPELRAAVDAACRRMSDGAFRQLVRA